MEMSHDSLLNLGLGKRRKARLNEQRKEGLHLNIAAVTATALATAKKRKEPSHPVGVFLP